VFVFDGHGIPDARHSSLFQLGDRRVRGLTALAEPSDGGRSTASADEGVETVPEAEGAKRQECCQRERVVLAEHTALAGLVG
jgi:hypothetical protein